MRLAIAWFPLAAVLLLIAVQLLPGDGEQVVERSPMYKPLVFAVIIAGAVIELWALVHLWRNRAVGRGERIGWTFAILFAAIFAIPAYVSRDGTSNPTP